MVDDMAAVLCPPYDLITPQIQQALMDRHPLNVIHLEAGEGLDWSADPAGRYAETAERFEEWLQERRAAAGGGAMLLPAPARVQP